MQIRSKVYDDHVVKGYQGDIADKRYMGILYEEGGRGILADVDPEKVMPHLKAGEWNDYVITADGPHIKQVLNGHTTIDYTETSDEGATDGIIALQLHVGPKMRIWFKGHRDQRTRLSADHRDNNNNDSSTPAVCWSCLCAAVTSAAVVSTVRIGAPLGNLRANGRDVGDGWPIAVAVELRNAINERVGDRDVATGEEDRLARAAIVS